MLLLHGGNDTARSTVVVVLVVVLGVLAQTHTHTRSIDLTLKNESRPSTTPTTRSNQPQHGLFLPPPLPPRLSAAPPTDQLSIHLQRPLVTADRLTDRPTVHTYTPTPPPYLDDGLDVLGAHVDARVLQEQGREGHHQLLLLCGGELGQRHRDGGLGLDCFGCVGGCGDQSVRAIAACLLWGGRR
jgi:hypothetical protein